MKKFLLLLQILVVSALCMISCGKGNVVSPTCSMTVKSTYNDFSCYLQLPAGEIIDTLSFNDGVAFLERSDTLNMPYVAYLYFVNRQDSLDTMNMPVVVEKGQVSVSVSEYISTAGTPLNARLQSFLNDLQMVSEGIREKGIKSIDEINSAYSSYYKMQIMQNKDNVVGKYIYEYYGIHLNDADRKSLEAVMN